MKVAVLGTKSNATFAVCNYLEGRFPGCAFIFEQPVNRWRLIKRRIKNLGLFQVAGQVAFRLVVSPVLRRLSTSRVMEIQDLYRLSIKAPEQKASHDVSSVNEPETAELLERLAPDVIVLAGTRIVSKELLARVPCPVVNIHAGITPLYRGVHGGYWALVEGHPELCGVTVHRVDAGIDTETMLAQSLISPTRADNFANYPWLQMNEGLVLLTALLPRLAAGEDVKFVPLTAESKLRHHPTIWEYFLGPVR